MGAKPSVVDLFCGAGGLSIGFIQAGFDVIRAIDSNSSAVESYRVNIADHVVCAEITEDIELPQSTVVIGGPPCQGFSAAGLRLVGDTRNTLVGCFARLVARAKPRAFVFENVEGFLTAEKGDRVLELLEPIIDAGYRVHLRKINAANYGVPQHRKRVIAIGGLGWSPSFPSPTHSAHGAPGAHLAGYHLPRSQALLEAICGLGAPAVREPGEPEDHYCLPLGAKDLARARALKPGQTMRDLPKSLWHNSYGRRAFRRVKDGTPSERRGGAPSGLRRLRPDEPAKAITGGSRSDFLHPTEDRYLTIRECARIQTFPDRFRFCGSARDRIQLIGNAVPPALSSLIAKTLAADLRLATDFRASGALLSFIPTLSNGMSPALKAVSRVVASTFGEDSHNPRLTLWP
jgi:DNA (cytosine-5)-methyltransferase 1